MQTKEVKKILSKCLWRGREPFHRMRDFLIFNASSITRYQHLRFISPQLPQPFYNYTPLHYLDGEMLQCTKETLNICPVCEHATFRWKLYEQLKLQIDSQLAKTLFRKEMYSANVVNRATGEIELFTFGATLKKNLVEIIVDHGIDHIDLIRGHDIHIFRTGHGFETRYHIFAEKKPSYLVGDKKDRVESVSEKIKLVLSQQIQPAEHKIENIQKLQNALQKYLSEFRAAS